MLSGNQRVQRAVVAVIIGVVVLGMTLSLVSVAVASPAGRPAAAGQDALAASPTPEPIEASLTQNGNPKPVTKTPQGQATQVTDGEHIGGLVGFIVLMLGGVALLIRDHRRKRSTRT